MILFRITHDRIDHENETCKSYTGRQHNTTETKYIGVIGLRCSTGPQHKQKTDDDYNERHSYKYNISLAEGKLRFLLMSRRTTGIGLSFRQPYIPLLQHLRRS